MRNSEYYRNGLETEVFSASPVELVRLMYRAAVESVSQARHCLEQGDIEGRNRSINRCLAILTELSTSLDTTLGGEIGRSLAELYDYMLRRLNEANLQQTDGPLAETAELLCTLLEGWSQCTSEPELETSVAAVPPPLYDAAPEYRPAAWSC